MAKQLPPVDDDVFEGLQQLAEPLVDDINSVLRRLLNLDSGNDGAEPGTTDRQRSEVEELTAVEARRSQGSSTPRKAPAKKPAAKKAPAKKAPRRRNSGSTRRAKGSSSRPARGSLLPEQAYEEPLLQALVAAGGSAPASSLIEQVGVALADQLTDADRESLDSGLIRWKNRVQFVRLKLVQAGQMKKESPRGVWEITQPGRDRVASFSNVD